MYFVFHEALTQSLVTNSSTHSWLIDKYPVTYRYSAVNLVEKIDIGSFVKVKHVTRFLDFLTPSPPIVTRFPHFIHVLRCFKKTVTQLTTPSPPFRVTYFTNDPYFNFKMKLNV